MGLLWTYLDPTQDQVKARMASGSQQCEKVERLARERLTGRLLDDVLDAVKAADAARKRRNEVVHAHWLLRGLDSMRPVTEISHVPAEKLSSYLRAWERESRGSTQWRWVPRDSLQVTPAQGV